MCDTCVVSQKLATIVMRDMPERDTLMDNLEEEFYQWFGIRRPAKNSATTLLVAINEGIKDVPDTILNYAVLAATRVHVEKLVPMRNMCQAMLTVKSIAKNVSVVDTESDSLNDQEITLMASALLTCTVVLDTLEDPEETYNDEYRDSLTSLRNKILNQLNKAKIRSDGAVLTVIPF